MDYSAVGDTTKAPKRLLQTASVLGREFSLHLLAAIWDSPEAPQPLLQELTRLEFLYERTGAEEPTYVFKHAVTQEVAYASLLTTRRQGLKETAAEAKLAKRVYLHLLRHSVATTLLERGMPLAQIQRLLGHAQLETTQIYAESTPEMIKESYQRALAG